MYLPTFFQILTIIISTTSRVKITMKRKTLLCCLVLSALVLPHVANATNNHYGGVAAKIGTLGFGLEYIQPVTEHFGARLGFNLLEWDYDLDETDISYNGDLELRSFSLMADYHPWAESFRVTAGLLFNGNEISVTAKPSGNKTYTINHVDYPASAIDSLQGEVSFTKLAPYFGIGWGTYPTSNHNWSFNADLGVVYHGEPDPSLSVQCSPSLSPAACSQLRANVAAEQQDLKDEMSDFRWYPVIAIGVSYSF